MCSWCNKDNRNVLTHVLTNALKNVSLTNILIVPTYVLTNVHKNKKAPCLPPKQNTQTKKTKTRTFKKCVSFDWR